MEFKKLLYKKHDRKSYTPVSPSQQSSVGDKLAKWRDKWGDVARPRLFHSKHKQPLNKQSLSPEVLPQDSTPTLLQRRPHSTIQVDEQRRRIPRRPVTMIPPKQQLQQPQQPQQQLQQQRQQKQQEEGYRLSVPHVVDHLRSISLTPTTCTFSSLELTDVIQADHDDKYDAGSLGNLLSNGLPSRTIVWCGRPYSHKDESLDRPHLESPTTTSSSTSSSSIHSDPGSVGTNNHRHLMEPKLFSATHSLSNETLQQQQDSILHLDELPSEEKTLTLTADSTSLREQHDTLAILNVDNTMRMMREHQLELQLTKIRIENQQLQQQMDDMMNGSWSSTTQLLQENEKLERQVQQLQLQTRWDEQDALRHTRAQLGLVEYLEDEPDIRAALTRFKKLLASSC